MIVDISAFSQAGARRGSKFTFYPRHYFLELLPERADNTFKPMKTNYLVSSLLTYKPAALWSVGPETTVFDAIGLMAAKNIGALLVLADGKLLGIFTERDYTRKIALQGKSSRDTRVREVASDKVLTVTPDDSVEDCMRLMTDNRVRHLPVVADGKVAGIVSIGDVVNWTISTQDAAIEQMERYIAGGVAA
jgi:signal-transduction protein with cAMP-binding, CBS, and nucleotidyltransferase domain